MSVTRDLLLQPAPEVRPRAAVAKASTDVPGASRADASSFAEVYARTCDEQSAGPKEGDVDGSAERPSAASSGAESSPWVQVPVSAAGVEIAVEGTMLAESGNALPQVDTEDGIEPMLPLTIAGLMEPDSMVVADPSALTDSTEPHSTPGAGAGQVNPLAGSAAQTVLHEASHDPELDMLNSLTALKLSSEPGAQEKTAMQQQLSPAMVAVEKSASANQAFTSALAALSAEAMLEEGGEEELLGEVQEARAGSVRESQSEARAELLAGKLSPLSQAIGQQHGVQRLPLVPGQPLSMNHPGMSEAVVDRVMWLSSQNLKSAEIQLDPAELGRMEVRIELHKDQAAQVNFISANPSVREQLEGQIHRLRELFAQQGIDQLDVNVSDQSMAQGSREGGEQGRGRPAGRDQLDAGEDERLMGVSELRGVQSSAAARGLVDYYA